MANGDTDYSPYLARNLREILDSDRFVVECFNQRELTISQALCLLWHNQNTGDVPGRKTSAPLFGSVTAAVLIDLIVLGRIDFEDDRKSIGKHKQTLLKVRCYRVLSSAIKFYLSSRGVAYSLDQQSSSIRQSKKRYFQP